MTYQFLCRYFKPKAAAWITAIWFAILLIAIIVLSVFDEETFIYKNF